MLFLLRRRGINRTYDETRDGDDLDACENELAFTVDTYK